MTPFEQYKKESQDQPEIATISMTKKFAFELRRILGDYRLYLAKHQPDSQALNVCNAMLKEIDAAHGMNEPSAEPLDVFNP